MIKPKRSAEQQVADEADRRALNPMASRQTISDSQAEPAFQENHKRLKADRLAREAGLKVKSEIARSSHRDETSAPSPIHAGPTPSPSSLGRDRAEGDGEMTRPVADYSMVVAVVCLALAVLAGALLILKRMVRKKDVIKGGYVERDEED
jgi:hypothetical protein